MTAIKIAFDIDTVDWAKGDGLAPAIVQNAASLRVLMLGYMNRAALLQTLEFGKVTFYSRSKQRLWEKGETSGHQFQCREIRLDCDGDTLLVMVDAQGPACHRGTQTCFGAGETPVSIGALADLATTIRQRRRDAPPGSYSRQSCSRPACGRIAQKVGEEGVEVALAAGKRGRTRRGIRPICSITCWFFSKRAAPALTR